MATVTAPASTTRRRRAMPAWVGGLIGIVILIVLWQLVGLSSWGKSHYVPPPTHILAQMRDDGWSLYWPNVRTTMHEAFVGYLWGNVLAIGLAFLFLLLPWLERPLMRLGVASYCLPIIAIGPILLIVFNGQTPKIILAALSVFFTTLVGMLLGLRSANKTALDLVRAYGGGAWKQVTKVRLRAALPSLFAALRIAAPAAILGAIIGEYLGGDSGLGVAMIHSEQAFEIERTWALALIATLLAGIAYAITALVGRALTPWADRQS
jgi:ABC-type nitrate/sulfonate/bicarbonate transport system permease component